MVSVYNLYRDAWRYMAQGDLRRLADLAAPDFQLAVNGAEYDLLGMQEFVKAWRAAFSDFGRSRKEFDFVDNDVDTIAVYHSLTLTHDGTFVTPAGTFPPSGLTAELTCVDLVTLDSSRSKIGRWVVVFDTAQLVGQLH